MDFLLMLEGLPPSVWLRYSLSLFAFPFVIAMHTIGLAWLVGPNLIIDLRILGFAPSMSLSSMGRFLPVMIVGFWINLITGAWLSIAYATTMLTNPMVYIKLAFIIVAIVILRLQMTRVIRSASADDPVLPSRARVLAAASIVCWIMAITTGRMMAYAGLFFG
jgi:hypothetical protein